MSESNPYGLLAVPGGRVVADAGGNDLLWVPSNGDTSALAVFPSRPQGRATDSVPTSVALGPDGAYYVGELTGAPFFVDIARVYRVVPGQAPEPYGPLFSFIGDLAWGPDGHLYVLQIASGRAPAPGLGRPSRSDGTKTSLITGLESPAPPRLRPGRRLRLEPEHKRCGNGEVLRFELPSSPFRAAAARLHLPHHHHHHRRLLLRRPLRFLPPPPPPPLRSPPTCVVPRLIGLRLATARFVVYRAKCFGRPRPSGANDRAARRQGDRSGSEGRSPARLSPTSTSSSAAAASRSVGRALRRGLGLRAPRSDRPRTRRAAHRPRVSEARRRSLTRSPSSSAIGPDTADWSNVSCHAHLVVDLPGRLGPVHGRVILLEDPGPETPSVG